MSFVGWSRDGALPAAKKWSRQYFRREETSFPSSAKGFIGNGGSCDAWYKRWKVRRDCLNEKYTLWFRVLCASSGLLRKTRANATTRKTLPHLRKSNGVILRASLFLSTNQNCLSPPFLAPMLPTVWACEKKWRDFPGRDHLRVFWGSFEDLLRRDFEEGSLVQTLWMRKDQTWRGKCICSVQENAEK